MESVLFLAHTNQDGSLPKIALETLGAARKVSKELGANLTVGLLGADVESAAGSISDCGASQFYAVSGPEFSTSRYGSDILAAEALIRSSKASIVMAPATSRFSRSLPGVSCRVEGRIDTHIAGFDCSAGSLTVQRWYYRQRMMATFNRTERPWILLVDPGTSLAWQGKGGSATLTRIAVTVPATHSRTEVTGFEAPPADAQTIRPEADLLFVAGAGWTKKQADGQPHIAEAEELIKGFLGKTKASLGSSKSLVDQSSEGHAVMSIMSHLNQVGQTGSTPRHPRGLAACCHGEEPHVIGWRFINDRRAINLDPNCGWAQGKADVLYVADAFAVMRKVNELL